MVPSRSAKANGARWLAENEALTPEQLQDYAPDLWYVNVHTPDNPGGKVRGQIGNAPAVTLGAVPGRVSGNVPLTGEASDDVGPSAPATRQHRRD